jgi:non-canonical purine NTP pyrophosphatase (RdgB/HAM1 family)
MRKTSRSAGTKHEHQGPEVCALNPDVRFATSNALKLQEARALVPGLLPFSCDLPEIQAIDVVEVVRYKAQLIADMDLPFPILVEDTGLEIPSLGRLPGALVKWFIASIGSRRLAEIALGERDSEPALAVSAVAALYRGEVNVTVGRVQGLLVAPRGVELGWNSIFQPGNFNRTFGEMSDLDRLAVSMRRAPILDAVAWITSRKGNATSPSPADGESLIP